LENGNERIKMNLLFLDTETTNKDETARLVQLAYKYEGSMVYNEYFKPPVPIDFGAMATHHITNEFVEIYPPFENSAAKMQVQSLLNNMIMVAHNAEFDKAILEREGVKVPKFICTLKLAHYFYDLPQYKLQYLRYWAGIKLDARAHDAEGDIKVLQEVFKHFYKILEESLDFGEAEKTNKILEKMMEISAQPTVLKRITFGKHKGKKFEECPADYLQWLSRQDDLDEDLKHTINYHLKK